MTTTTTGSGRSRAVAAGAPSVAHLLDLTLSVRNIPWTIDPSTVSLYVGKASAAPTTFAGLTGPIRVDGAADFMSYQYNYIEGGGLQLQIRDNCSLSTFAAGDHLWACLFDALDPSGTDPVVAHLDLGLAVA